MKYKREILIALAFGFAAFVMTFLVIKAGSLIDYILSHKAADIMMLLLLIVLVTTSQYFCLKRNRNLNFFETTFFGWLTFLFFVILMLAWAALYRHISFTGSAETILKILVSSLVPCAITTYFAKKYALKRRKIVREDILDDFEADNEEKEI